MSHLDAESRRIRRTSSGSVILREIDGKWHALLLRAWSHWDFPKGNVETGETLLEAALREVKEETGIYDLEFPWGRAFARTSVYSRDKVAYYSVATSKTSTVVLAPNPTTGKCEHEEFRWVPWVEVAGLISPRLSGITEWVENVTHVQNFLPKIAADVSTEHVVSFEITDPTALTVVETKRKPRNAYGRQRRR